MASLRLLNLTSAMLLLSIIVIAVSTRIHPPSAEITTNSPSAEPTTHSPSAEPTTHSPSAEPRTRSPSAEPTTQSPSAEPLQLISTRLEVTAPPTALSILVNDGWFKYVSVFGVHVVAQKNVPTEKVLHVANVIAEQLDNNQDGIADNPDLVRMLNENKAAMVIPVSTCSNPGTVIESLKWETMCVFGKEISLVANDRKDATFEETSHLIFRAGLSPLYSQQLGTTFRTPSTLTQIMDKARGGRYRKVPKKYPSSAIYSYSDTTCTYDCQAVEFFWWGLSSRLGFNAASCRTSNPIYKEFKACTPAKMVELLPDFEALLNDENFKLPVKLPKGKYVPNA